MLDNLDDLLRIIFERLDVFFKWRPDVGKARTGSDRIIEPVVAGDLFCPRCGDYRKMKIELLDRAGAQLDQFYAYYSKKHAPGVPALAMGGPLAAPSDEADEKDDEASDVNRLGAALTPSLLIYRCVQCDGNFTAVIHPGPDGSSLAVLPAVRGGLRTPHTPEGVAYYLDEAQKAMAVGARSAAVAMYRGALEHLLYEQGLPKGMLGQKLSELERRISDGSGPKWAQDLDNTFLRVLKDLGNGAIHPNDGDVARQTTLDGECLDDVSETFMHLLFLVYEIPHQKSMRLSKLQARAKALNK